MTSISVLGGGTWGTALAICAHRAGNNTTLWMRDFDQANKIQKTRFNEKYLPHIILDQDINITSSLDFALDSNIILFVCPMQNLRTLLTSIKDKISINSYLILCSKGIELETGKLTTQIVSDILPNHSSSVLSGPTFALEVAQEYPTAATLASEEISTARWLASSLSSTHFRLYPGSDPIGVQVSGALKNVIAIAAGIVAARCLGESAQASLIARGLAEISRLGLSMGAYPETFLGLSGVGDIILTCKSLQSRNMTYGFEIGRLEYLKNNNQNTLIEGYFTAKAVFELAVSKNIELPIIECVYRILYEQSLIDSEIKLLLSRPLKTEHYGFQKK